MKFGDENKYQEYILLSNNHNNPFNRHITRNYFM